MAYLNQIHLIGNVGADPQIRAIQGGEKVATFNLACTEKFTSNDGQRHENTTWFSIKVWGKQAGVIEEYVHKGDSLYIEGKVSLNTYVAQDGSQRANIEVKATTFQLLNPRQREEQPQAQAKPQTQARPQAQPQAQKRTPLYEQITKQEPDEDLPF